MADCEEIGAFKKNLKILAAAVANDKLSFTAEMTKVWSWIEWVDEGPEVHAGCTAAHQNYMRIQGACEILVSVLRRKYDNAETELSAARKYISWCIGISAVNFRKRLDTDRLFMLIATPDFNFYSAFDRPMPYRSMLEAGAKETAARDNNAMEVENAVAPLTSPALPQKQGSDTDASFDPSMFDGTFLSQLRPEDVFDFLREDGCWVLARIVELSPTETEIHVEDLQNSEKFWLSIEDAHRFARMGSRVGAAVASGTLPAAPPTVPAEELAWRQRHFTVGKLLDLQDKSSKRWYQAVVVDHRPPSAATGSQELKLHYLGWGAKYDEWIPLDSTRLDRLNYRSVGRRGTAVAETFEAEQERDPPDSEFLAMDPPGEALVQRPVSNFVFQKGPIYVEFLQDFWRQAIENFVGRITSTTHKEALSWVSEVSASLAYASDLYTETFVSLVIAPWIGFVEDFVDGMDENDVRGVTKDYVDALVLSLRRLGRRAFASAQEAGQHAETLLLNVALKCLKSSQIMRRLDGVKLVSEARTLAFNAAVHPTGVSFFAAANEHYRWPLASWLTLQQLSEWVTAQNIIHDIFVSRHHAQLVKISGDIFRLIFADPGRAGVQVALSPQECAEIVDDVCSTLALGTSDVDASVALICEIVTDLPPAAIARLLHHVEKVSIVETKACSSVSLHTVKLLGAIALSDPRNVVQLRNVSLETPSGLIQHAMACLASLSLGAVPFGGDLDSAAAVDLVIADVALKSFLSCLQHSSLSPLRWCFMELCVEFIARRWFPLRAIAVLQGIVDTYPSKKSEKHVSLPPILLSQEFLASTGVTAAAKPDVSPRPSPSTPPALDPYSGDLCMSEVVSMLQERHNVIGVVIAFLNEISEVARVDFLRRGILPLCFVLRLRTLPAGDFSKESIFKQIDSCGIPADALNALQVQMAKAATEPETTWSASVAALDDVAITLCPDLTPMSAHVADNCLATFECRSTIVKFASRNRLGLCETTFPGMVRPCFAFLGYIMQHSSITLTWAAAAELWDVCVVNALSFMQRTLCLAWFTQGVSMLAKCEGPTSLQADTALLSAVQGRYITPHIACTLFLERLNGEAFTSGAQWMDVACFTAWRVFFVYCNGHEKKLHHSGACIERAGIASDSLLAPPSGKDATVLGEAGLLVSSLDLIGVDTLWDITLRAQDAAVAALAVGFLTTLQQKLSPELQPRLGEFRENYITRCIQYISSVCSPGISSAEEAELWSSPATTLVNAPSPAKKPLVRGLSSSTAVAGLQMDQLASRCIALMDSLLDGAEEESYEVTERIRHLLTLAHGSSDTSAQSASSFAKARMMLSHMYHAPIAVSMAENAFTNGTKATSKAGYIQLRLNITVKVFDYSAPKTHSEAICESKLADEFKSDDRHSVADSIDTVIEKLPDGFIGPTLPPQGTSNTSSGAKAEDPTDSGVPGKYNIRAEDVKVTVRIHEPLCVLRFLVADLLGLPSSEFRILLPAPAFYSTGIDARPKELKGAFLAKTAAQLGLRDGATLPVISRQLSKAQHNDEVNRRTACLHETPDMAHDLRALDCMPGWLVARHPQAITLLISLASQQHSSSNVSPVTSARAWQLLCRVPTHWTFLQHMYSAAESVDTYWRAALPSDNVAKLCYGLLTLKSILSRSRAVHDKSISLDVMSSLSCPHAFATSRVVGGKDADRLLGRLDAVTCSSVEGMSSSQGWHDGGVRDSMALWHEVFCARGGFSHIVALLQTLLVQQNVRDMWLGEGDPLRLSASSLLIECTHAYTHQAYKKLRPLIHTIPFHSLGVAFDAPDLTSGLAASVATHAPARVLHTIAVSVLVTAFDPSLPDNTASSAFVCPQHIASLSSIMCGSISLWTHAVLYDPIEWKRSLSSDIKLLECLCGYLANCLDRSDFAEQLRCVIAVAIHSVCHFMPTLSGSAASPLAVTPLSDKHPHEYFLSSFLEARPSLQVQFIQCSSPYSLWYALVEALLRDTLGSVCGPGAAEYGHYAKLASQLVSELKRLPILETTLSATFSHTALLPTIARAELWSDTQETAVLSPFGGDCFGDCTVFARRHFASFKNGQLRAHGHTHAVDPMDAEFCNFAAADGAQDAAHLNNQRKVDVQRLISPIALAAADTAAATATIASFSNANIALETEVLCSIQGVDHVLVGTLRLLTAVCDFFPELAGDLGLHPAMTSSVAAPHPLASRHAHKDAVGLDLVNYVYRKCLFDSSIAAIVPATYMGEAAMSPGRSAEPHCLLYNIADEKAGEPICKSNISRRAAFRLLIALIRNSTRNLCAVACNMRDDACTMYDSADKTMQIPLGWRQDPASRDAIASTGYVGLRNLGCICYMNSLMQQFFMCEPFRYGLLSVSKPELLADKDKADSVLYQLQRMFGFLDVSKRKHYDPSGWCASYKDYDGRPTNVLIQQDAQEYLTTLLDRVEFALKDTPRRKLVQNVFGIESKEARFCTGGCGTMRSSSEPAVCLSVGVTQGNMKASLDSHVAWEDIPDYNCDICKRRTTLRKRNTIGQLSNTVIIHLKRFEMNYDTGMPNKLNNRFEFPVDLDLYPYSYECYLKQQANALKQQYEEQVESARTQGTPLPSPPTAIDITDSAPGAFDFELVGILVHMGTLESGHYYSFIRERGPRAFVKASEHAAASGATIPHCPDPSVYKGRWMEFNDSVVTDFDPAKIPEQCFGGSSSTLTWNTALKQHVNVEIPVVKNAYMLVYERRRPLPIRVESDELAQCCSTRVDKEFVLPTELVPLDRFGRGPIPESIALGCIDDNDRFGRLVRVMEVDNSLFLHTLADTLLQHPLLMKVSDVCYPPLRNNSTDAECSEQLNAKFQRDMELAKGKPDGSTTVVRRYQQLLDKSIRSFYAALSCTDIAKYLFLHCFTFVARSAHMHLVPHFAFSLARIAAVSTEHARHMLQSARSVVCATYDVLRENLIKSPIANVRGAFGRMLVCALVRLANEESQYFPPRYEKVAGSTSTGVRSISVASPMVASKEFLAHIISQDMLDTVSQSWKLMNSYFNTLYDVARFGFDTGIPMGYSCEAKDCEEVVECLGAYSRGVSIVEPLALFRHGSARSLPRAGQVLKHLLISGLRVRHGMVSMTLIESIMDFYMGQRKSLFVLNAPGVVRKRPVMGSKLATPVWTRAFDLLSLLIRSVFTNANEDWAPMSPYSVILGPIMPQVHGIAWPESTACAAPAVKAEATSSEGDSDVTLLLQRHIQLTAKREEDTASVVIPCQAKDPATLTAVPRELADLPFLGQLLVYSTSVDMSIVERSRDRVIKALKEYGAHMEKLLRSKTPIIVHDRAVSHVNDLPRDPASLDDIAGENAFGPYELKAGRDHPEREEGFTLLDTNIQTKQNQLKQLLNQHLWEILFGTDDEMAEQHSPEPLGVNPEGVSQIIAHLGYGDRQFSTKLLKLYSQAVDTASWDKLRELHVIGEAMMVIPDVLEVLRRVKLFSIMKNAYSESLRSSTPEASIEHASFLIRAAAVHPDLAVEHFVNDDSLVFELENWLRSLEANPKEGWGKSPAWLAAMVDLERRPEPSDPTAVNLNTMADREKEIYPLKHLMASVLTHRHALLNLPYREELHILSFVSFSLSLRATFLLKRLAAVLHAHGKTLLGPAEIARRCEILKALEGAGPSTSNILTDMPDLD